MTGWGSGPLRPVAVFHRESTRARLRSEGSGRPSSGLETPAGNALHSVGARAPLEGAVWVGCWAGPAGGCCRV